MVNTEFNTFKVDDSVSFVEQNKIVASLNLSDEHFDKVLSVTARVVAPTCEINGNEIRYGGRILFNVLYCSAGFERSETVAEFGYKKQIGCEGSFATVNYSLSEVVLKKNNGMIYAETVLSAHVFAKCETEASFVEGVDCLKKEDTISCYESFFSSLGIAVSEEFECDKLKNVLYNGCSAAVSSAECGHGVINVSGDVFLSLGLLPFLPNSDIVNKRVTVPFNFELDAPSATNESICYAKVCVEKASFKVYTQEDGEKSTVTCQIDLKIDAEYQVQADKTVVCDAYSNKYELDITKSSKKIKRLKGLVSTVQNYSSKFICQIPENSRFICATGESVEVTDCQKMVEGYKIDAVVSADMIFVDGEGEYVCVKGELPLTLDVEKNDQITSVNLTITAFSVKLKNGQLDAEITLQFTAKSEDECSVEYIDNINAISEKEPSTSAISVYIGQKGDDEWMVEKQFGVAIDEIYALNTTLQFPLNGGEKIIYYRQKI